MADIQQIVGVPITCHAFNRDRTEVAICPNSNEVLIFKKDSSGWTQTATLAEHDKLVTSVDWAPNTNRIVTCSQDRNAYVWTQEGKEWKPSLSILRIDRAATQVKWSPRGDKFAVASGAQCIGVCYFEKDNDWWVSKHIKKPIRSTVLSIDWHPNNVLIAAGSSDFKARVFSGWVKGVDDKPGACSWGDKFPFGDVLAEFNCGGWVHDVAFSPDGETIAFIGHDSSLNVVTGTAGQPVTVNTQFLPFTHLLWLTAKSVVAAGHDNNPMLFSNTGAWKFVEKLDAAKTEKKEAGGSAMSKFKEMDTRGRESDSDTQLRTVHQNAISGIAAHTGARGAITKFTTTGVDGKLVTWDVKSLEQAISGLKIA